MYEEAASRYRTQQVTTASPAELIGMLYDATVRWLRVALEATRNGDHATASNQLVRVQRVLTELRCSLDPSAGEIAVNLDNLYEYVSRRLIEANLRKDPVIIAEALDVLGPIRDAWSEACLGRVPALASPAA